MNSDRSRAQIEPSALVSNTAAPRASDPPSQVRRRPSSLLSVGSLFANGRYELLGAIAAGGTSVVHEVYDHVLDRKLAGKFMSLGEDDSARASALQEARATARLLHPNIITIYDVGVWGETPFLLMELLRGNTLADEIASKRLTPRRAIEIMIHVARGLEHAHQHGVLHLDLKPGNVHVGDDGVVKLLDFGVGSRHLDSLVSDVEPTVVGTPQYMAPEQWNFGALDQRTDVWALGIVFYESLSGRLPCEGRHPGFALTSGKRWPVPALSPGLGLPSAVDSLIHHTLAADPGRRCQTVREFLDILLAIERVLSDRDVLDRLKSVGQSLTTHLC